MAKVDTVVVAKGDEKVRVNKADVKDWEAKGYKASKAKAAPKPKAKIEADGEGEDSAPDAPEIKVSMSKGDIATALNDRAYDAIRDKIDLSQTRKDIVKAVDALMAE